MAKRHQTGLHQNPLAKPGRVNPLAEGHHMSADICPLNTRKAQGLACPTAIGDAAIVSRAIRIPADARIDVGIVDSRRPDPDQHLTGQRRGARKIGAIAELLIAPVTGQNHGRHQRGQCGFIGH
jgi:hypothetical protein